MVELPLAKGGVRNQRILLQRTQSAQFDHSQLKNVPECWVVAMKISGQRLAALTCIMEIALLL